MKNTLLFTFLCLASALCAQSGQQLHTQLLAANSTFLVSNGGLNETTSLSELQQKELEAIMSVIEAETTCFYNRDVTCWKRHWVQDKHTFQGWNNSDGTFDAIIGWKNVEKAATEYIQANPVQNKEAAPRKVIRKNMIVKFYGDDLAYLVWDQYNENRSRDQFTHSKDSRIMEKHNGQWKIANMTAFWDFKQQFSATELEN